MKIRTQLILAFFLLAILPLGGIVLFSYASSSAAVRESAIEEAEALSEEMEQRLDRVRENLRQRVANLPFRALTRVETDTDPREVVARLREQLGDMAVVVDAFAFEPSAAPPFPDPPAPPRVEARPEPSVRPEPRSPEPRSPATDVGGEAEAAARVLEVESRRESAPRDPEATRAWFVDLAERKTNRARERAEAEARAERQRHRERISRVQPRPGRPVDPPTPGQDDLGGDARALVDARAPVEIGPPSTLEIDPDLARLYLDSLREHLDPQLQLDLQLEGSGSAEGAEVRILDLERLEAWLNGTQRSMADLDGAREEAERQIEQGARADFTFPSVPEARREEWRKRARMVLGEDFEGMKIRDGDRVVGTVRPRINTQTLLDMVFGQMPREQGEIPFAVDADGNLYTAETDDRARLLGALGQPEGDNPVFASNRLPSRRVADRWVVATSRDPHTGMAFGVARPFGDALGRLQSTSVRNFAFGLLMIALALLGILPFSGHMARRLGQVTEAAQHIAKGNLETRVPVDGGGELAQLASAFNSMAHDLRDQQERLVEEERLKRERELERQLMHAELERRGKELEEARQFQLSLLPRQLPDHPDYRLAVCMHTATEVGGDYYDFRRVGDDRLVVALGDATGHGARAGTMVTAIKSLFTACPFQADSPATFLADAQHAVRRMRLGRMAMAMQVAQLDERVLRLSNAGMPPVLRHRAGRPTTVEHVEELLVTGMPLGGLQSQFRTLEVTLVPGDTLLFFSDGLAEQPGSDGEPVGYELVRRAFAAALEHAARSAAIDSETDDAPVLRHLEELIEELTGGEAPADDISLMTLRVR